MQGVHFTILPASPCAADFYETRHTRSTHRRNHECQIFSRSVQGLRSSDTPKLPSPIDCCIALTTVWHCRATLWLNCILLSLSAQYQNYWQIVYLTRNLKNQPKSISLGSKDNW